MIGNAERRGIRPSWLVKTITRSSPTPELSRRDEPHQARRLADEGRAIRGRLERLVRLPPTGAAPRAPHRLPRGHPAYATPPGRDHGSAAAPPKQERFNLRWHRAARHKPQTSLALISNIQREQPNARINRARAYSIQYHRRREQ